MKIIKKAQSGSFESSDIIVLIEHVVENSGRNIEIHYVGLSFPTHCH